MATPTLWELAEAVETRAKTIGLRSKAERPGSIDPPFLMVGVPPIPDYRATFGRGEVIIPNWPLTVLTSAEVDRVGQKKLAEYLSWTGPKSLIRALENEPTLGGVVIDLSCQSSRPLGVEEVGLIGYFGGELLITVEVSGEED
ncbi:hypothetical protein AB0M54_24330 [Actinoplanes sp. NPDC051470]|uniref:hypothetical protein n=1 Tax=Actinoplanes sp. NPDC051470 TaxID=3157224 RepID=UPI0034318486